MHSYSVPTSNDIYLEVNGQRLAVVESYRARARRDSKTVQAFGQTEPVATIAGRTSYVLELSRVYVTRQNLGESVDFYELSGFNLVVVKPDCRIVFSGCEWADIEESAGLNDTLIERVTILAAKRMVIR